MTPSRGFLMAAVLLLAACGGNNASFEELNSRPVTLPDGARIHAEVKITPQDMARGLMFRDALPRDHGMLFIHSAPGQYSYWMYQCKIPLDIVWMDANRSIVEISPDTPPCHSKPADCPSYGGHRTAQFVLELGGGEAQRHDLREGQTLTF